MPVRAVLIGAVESSRVFAERVAQAPGWTLALVLTLPSDKSRQHSDFVDLRPVAEAVGTAVREVDHINSDEAIDEIRKAEADYVFVVGWSQICGPKFRLACDGRIIGYHPAPLPRLRGRAVIPWTILNQEPITAGTLFWIDEGVDSGPLLMQEFFHVAPDESAATLYRKHMDALERLADRALEVLQAPHPPKIPQNGQFATWAARRRPADGLIDWTRPSTQIERLVRALSGPYPPASTMEGPHRIEIRTARIGEDGARFIGSCGQVVSSTTSEFSVKCGDGMILTITDWSHADGRAPKLHSILGLGKIESTVAGKAACASAAVCECGSELSRV
jgi:methionyl-tRNA formyltransferase